MKCALLIVCLAAALLTGCVVHRPVPMIGQRQAISYRVTDGACDYQLTIDIRHARVELREGRGDPPIVVSTGDVRVERAVRRILAVDLHSLRQRTDGAGIPEARGFRRVTISTIGPRGAVVAMRDYRVAGHLDESFYDLENLFEELASALQPVYGTGRAKWAKGLGTRQGG